MFTSTHKFQANGSGISHRVKLNRGISHMIGGRRIGFDTIERMAASLCSGHANRTVHNIDMRIVRIEANAQRRCYKR